LTGRNLLLRFTFIRGALAGYTATAKNQALTALVNTGAPANAWKWFSLHTGDPGTTGVNEVATGSGYNRQQASWGTASLSQIAAATVTFNVPAATTIQYWGIWTLVTAGVFGFSEALPSNQVYGTPGLYFMTVTLTLTG
jgi:hypothetical protein